MMPFSNKGPEPEQASKQRWQSIHTSCRYLFKLTEPILTRRTILKTLAFAIVIGGLMLSNAYSNVSVSDATKDLVDAVTRRYPLNLRLIYLTNAVEWVCIYALGTATFIYLRGRLAIYLRRHLTEKFVRVYFSNGAYYKLVELVHIKKLDNPDQRMQGDADSFSNSLPGITISFMDAAIQIGFWSHKLWYISVTLTCYVFAYA